jgi:hypothetical protein
MMGAPSIFVPSNTPRAPWPRIWPGWILGLMAVGIAGAIFYWTEQRQQPLGLNVHATDSTSQVRIAWDRASGTVRNARTGYVDIADGDQTVRVDLDANELQLGYVNYQRQSKNVTVRLVVEAHDGTPAEDLAQFVASADQAPAGQVAPSERSAGSAAGAAPDKTPYLEVPVPIESSQPVEPAKRHPKFQPPSAQPTREMLVDQAPAPEVATGRRASRRPHVSSGSEPPFTCSVGDMFRKTDAAPGWDTFTCRGKNVWSVTRTPDKL